MSNPTLSWVFDGPRTYTAAGANPTVAEILAALNTQIGTYSTYWQVSDYSVANGTLEIKRNSTGTPTGELATVRILFFGGQTPNAGALSLLHTAGANTGLYAALSVDANTTGPAASYASGAPYSTKYARGQLICTPSTGITSAQTPKITLFETVDSFGFALSDTTNFACYCGGRIIIRGKDDSLAWGNMASGSTWSLSNTTDSFATLNQAGAMPATSLSTNPIKCNYWDVDTASSRLFGRVIAFVSNTWSTANFLGANALATQIVRVPIYEQAAVAASTISYLGELRQMRLGPAAVHLNKLKDASAVLQATYIYGGTAQGAGGMWCDELP